MSDRARSRSPPRERSPPRDGGGDDRDRDSAPAAAAPEGSRSGTCARWHAERGFGFITPDDGGEDVFCHVSAITDGNALPEGGKVTFTVRFDDRQNKDRAQDVTGGCQEQSGNGGPPRDPGGAGGSGKLVGTVARWNGERGFGFISPEDGGEDVFCHVSSITDGNALPEGQKVTYDKEFDEQRGKERAQNVAGGMEEDRSQRMGGGGGCECSVLCALCSPVMLCVEKLVC